jgi:hypothetical protein
MSQPRWAHLLVAACAFLASASARAGSCPTLGNVPWSGCPSPDVDSCCPAGWSCDDGLGQPTCLGPLLSCDVAPFTCGASAGCCPRQSVEPAACADETCRIASVPAASDQCSAGVGLPAPCSACLQDSCCSQRSLCRSAPDCPAAVGCALACTNDACREACLEADSSSFAAAFVECVGGTTCEPTCLPTSGSGGSSGTGGASGKGGSSGTGGSFAVGGGSGKSGSSGIGGSGGKSGASGAAGKSGSGGSGGSVFPVGGSGGAATFVGGGGTGGTSTAGRAGSAGSVGVGGAGLAGRAAPRDPDDGRNEYFELDQLKQEQLGDAENASFCSLSVPGGASGFCVWGIVLGGAALLRRRARR